MKKITYLVASLLLMGTTPMLTGCIDNDEPAGIELLRGAKSELLKAKAAVENAKVATEQANAAYRNAEAEYMKAKAAYEAALAAKVNAETESAKAKAEQELAEAKAAAEQAAKEWELKYKTAEALYQNLLVYLATQQSQNIDDALADYRKAVKTTKKTLDESAEELRKKQRNFDKALADLEEDEAKRELNTRGLQKQVVLAERSVEGAEIALAEAKEEYEEAQNMKLDDVAIKRDELKAEIARLDKEVFDLRVAAAEKVCEYWQTLGAEYFTHYQEWVDMKEKEIQIPAFSLKVNGALPDGQQGSYDAEAAVYTLNKKAAYKNRKEDLEELQAIVLSWVRDEDNNDDLWTAERIAKMKQDIEGLVKALDETKKLWKDAVAAYNTNQADVTDPTKITGYAELKTAVDNYNVAAIAWNTVNKKVVDAQAAKKAANATYKAEMEKIEAAYEEAMLAAQKAYEENGAKIPEQAKSEAEKLSKAVTDAQTAFAAAEKAYDENTDPEKVTELYLAKEKAKLVLENAQKEFKTEGELLTSLNEENEEAREAAEKAALVKAATDSEAAEELKDKVLEEQNTIISEIKKEGGELEIATKTLDEAVAAICDDGKAFDVFYNNASEAAVITDARIFIEAARGAVDENGQPYAEEVDIKELTELDKTALTKIINILSEKLYGTATFTKNEYGDFEARLTEISEATIKEYAQKELEKEASIGKNGEITSNIVKLNDYVGIYNKFGLTGQLMSMNALIELAEKWMTNDEDVIAMVETVQTALDELIATNETATEAAEEKKKSLDEEFKDLQIKISEVNLPAEEAECKNRPLKELLASYEELINQYKLVGGADGKLFDEKLLANYVEECKAAIVTKEDELYDAETKLMRAKQNLADYESAKKSAFDTAEEELEDAQAAYKVAEENYNVALEALNNKIAELSVSAE